jgi:23S rRNA (guanine1835-N2)-methyltransferase
MQTLLEAPQGRFSLQRLPRRPRELLRAWDSADEYLLQHLAETAELSHGRRLLIVNDAFGALAVALHACQPQALSDSWLSQAATRLNLAVNGLPEDGVKLSGSLETPQGPFDRILIKVPKTLALLEDQLTRLRPQMTGSTRVIAAGMVKGLTPRVWELLERLAGPTTTSLARKKARLIFADVDPGLQVPPSPYPVEYRLEGTGYLISNHANVFSRDSLDIGTRFFLQYLPSRPEARDIVDLGCGNGVVGLIAAEKNPQAMIHFVDESYMAVDSAQQNFRNAFGTSRKASFRVGDGLSDSNDDSCDLVLCNPPFHLHSAVGDQIALRMFRQSHRALRKDGELWVIANRHLGYHVRLRRLFASVELVASNKKFVVLRAGKQPTRAC